MRKANLSYKLVEKYLEQVVGSGLIHCEESKYILTDLGRVFLNRYEDYFVRCAEAEGCLESLSYERQNLLRMCESRGFVDSIAAVQ